MDPAFEAIGTNDGSTTLKSLHYDATYHSTHGAVQESQWVYIQHGLEAWIAKHAIPQQPIRIFEMGFGTGLNALLCQASKHPIEYTTIELHPLEQALIQQLKFPLPEQQSAVASLLKLHDLTWETWHEVSPSFKIKKTSGDFLDLDVVEPYDVLFYDAFGPGTQAELWSLEACHKIAQLMDQGAIMSTFCAQGQFKRNLKEVGLKVIAQAGPIGKREITTAWKTV